MKIDCTKAEGRHQELTIAEMVDAIMARLLDARLLLEVSGKDHTELWEFFTGFGQFKGHPMVKLADFILTYPVLDTEAPAVAEALAKLK